MLPNAWAQLVPLRHDQMPQLVHSPVTATAAASPVTTVTKATTKATVTSTVYAFSTTGPNMLMHVLREPQRGLSTAQLSYVPKALTRLVLATTRWCLSLRPLFLSAGASTAASTLTAFLAKPIRTLPLVRSYTLYDSERWTRALPSVECH